MKTFFAGSPALLAWLIACDSSPKSHVYVAAPYDAANGCFGASVSLAYVDTPSGSFDCAPTCIVFDGAVYVSTMCGPYPSTSDPSQTDPDCPAALSAWPAEATALTNGGDSCASPADADGGGPADAPGAG
jgi:hypothetical protein